MKTLMRQARPQRRLLTGLAWLAVFGVLLLAGVLGRAWALPGRAPLGQTVPPPPTLTSTATVAEPTATWTPRPTWTRVVIEPTQSPTATLTPVENPPTATPPPLPTLTEVPLQATATPVTITPAPTMTSAPSPTPTVLAPQPTPQPTDTPSRPLPTAASPTTPALAPIPLAFEVAVVPSVAGPQDVVQFILQVANVGYEAVDGVQVEVVFPDDLWFQFVQCPRCTTDCPQCHGGPVIGKLTIFVGRLVSGDQVIAPVQMEVADDVWPGRTLRSEWTLTATGLPTQAVEADLVLPWAPLPSTGGQ